MWGTDALQEDPTFWQNIDAPKDATSRTSKERCYSIMLSNYY